MKKIIVKTIIGANILLCGFGGITQIVNEVKYNSNKNNYSVYSSSNYVVEETSSYVDDIKEEMKKDRELAIKEKEEKQEKVKKTFKKPVKKIKSNQKVTKKSGSKVWITGSGRKYHSHNNCGKTNSKNARLVTLSEAQKNCTPCKKCF